MSAAGAQYGVGHHLLSREQRLLRMPGAGGHHPADGVDDPVLPLNDDTANNSIFRYDDGVESPPNGSLADSFVSSRKKRQREYRLIQQKLNKDSQLGQSGSNRLCRQCCNGQLVPDYCSIF